MIFDSIGQKILENNFLHLNHFKILVSSLYRDEILFSIKIMGFLSVFLFCTKKKKITKFIWREKKISSLYRDETTILTWFIWRNKFFPTLFALYLRKSKEFLSSLVFHTVLWTTVFHHILLFLLNKILLVILWNNLNSNSVEY